MTTMTTNTTTRQVHTFECDIETFATYLADTHYIEARYCDTEIICRNTDGSLETFTITP